MVHLAIRVEKTNLKKEFFVETNFQLSGIKPAGWSSLTIVSKTPYLRLPPAIKKNLKENGIDIESDSEQYNILFILDCNHNNRSFKILAQFEPKISELEVKDK